MLNFKKVTDSVDDLRREEIRSFYARLQEGIRDGIPFDTVASVDLAIERDFSEELTLSDSSESGSEQAIYFSNIRDLLNIVTASVNDSDYEAGY